VLLADHWYTGSHAVPRTFYLPDVPAGTTWPIKIEMGEYTGGARLNLTWQTPGSGSQVNIPATALNPGYGLATTTTSVDTGAATASMVTTSSYGDKPWEGLAVSVTQADGGAGLTSQVSYDTLRRRTARALPTGDISNLDKRWTDTYYGNTETRDNPCVGGSAAVNQAGRLKTNTGPLNSSGGRVTTEAVYDILGRVVAARINTGGWVCTSYDTRGRVTTVAHPATTDDPGTPINETLAARTATTTYAVGGNPLVTSTTDAAGTITSTVDRLGRAVSYTDVHGTVTTSTYCQDGKLTAEATTGAGGGTTSTLVYTYTPTGQIDIVTLDGSTISTSTYDTAGELTGVAYSNTTSGTVTRDSQGRIGTLAWALAGGR
jgi:YD repeat-containing protein